MRESQVLPRARTMRASSRRGEAGELLIETLLTVLLMATVIVGGSYMLATAVKVSALHQDVVRTTDEAAVASEALARIPYLRCGGSGASAPSTVVGASPPTVANYQQLLSSTYTAPSGISATIKVNSIGFLHGVAATDTTAAFDPTCPAADLGAQKLTVTVVSSSGSNIGSSVVFVKRDDWCQDATGHDRLLGGAQPGQTC